MRSKIFKYNFLVAMTVFLLCGALFLWALYHYGARQHWTELENETAYLAAAIEEYGYEFLETTDREATSRVTLVDGSGRVLFDSVSDAETMDSHAQREEIAEALQNGIGRSERYSDTLLQKTANYAVRLKDGSVLRVSASQYTVWTMLVDMFYPIFWILLIAVVLALILAARISHSITEPIWRLDLNDPDERDVYEELKPLVTRLQAQNREIQRNLKQLSREHEERDSLRREFTANVSHELKTPLTAISGTAEILQGGLVKPEDVPRFAGNIYRETRRLTSLVNDILELSRLEETSLPEEMKPVDLLALSTEVAERLAGQAAEKHVAVRVEGTPETVCGSRKILDEMVYNLCDNAIKYNRDGGSVTVSVTREAGGAVLTVRDTGIGIPKNELPRIFERFYRVDKSHSKEIGGTGLGLSIVKHGAKYHNAAVTVDSEPSVGTTFRVRFPPGEAPTDAGTPSVVPGESAGAAPVKGTPHP